MIVDKVFCTEKELEMIRQSVVYRETMHRKESIKKEFFAVQHALHQCPHIFGDVTFGSFMHAYSLVGSCTWGIISKGLALIPFADFFNHDGSSKVVLLSDEDENFLEVEIWMGLSQRDPLCKCKIELHSHNMITLLDANGYDIGQNYFIIKEVRTLIGRGRGIPHSLKAFSRVLCACSTIELVDMAIEATTYDGRLARRPLKNRSKEIQVMTLLLARIETLI